ncbi:hypothetical protein OROMI_002097 [Orobanche minor]
MEDQYGIADLRQYIAGRPFFPSIYPTPDLPSVHRSLASGHHHHHPYYMLNFRPDNSTTIPPVAAEDTGGSLPAPGFETEAIGGAGRWPRQETLTLLEIRSRLDPKFKQANQKTPLWDEVSRIMYDDHGYQRSGKKCREKFENLYKYYKKTKGGKAGRQDGKHYRFFRQLEALYGEQTSNNNNNNSPPSVSEADLIGSDFQYDFPKNTSSSFPTPITTTNNNNQESYTSLISISNSSDLDAIITSDDDGELNLLQTDTNDPKKKKKIEKKSLKSKIKDSIDAQMKKMMDKQEAWMEKMMNTIEENEKERIFREQQWRKQDAERIEREHKMWAREKAWIQARDSALMDVFGKLTGKELRVSSREEELVVKNLSKNRNDNDWEENITRRISMYRDHQSNEPISEQRIGIGNSPRGYDALSDSCFRYLDAYGRNMN